MSYEVAAPNTVLAGPTSGPAAPPAMRAIVAADVPLLNQSTTGTAGGLSTTLAITSGGTGATTAPAALSALGALPAAGGTMTGPLTLNADATNPLQAVTFEQLQAVVSGNEYKAAVYVSAIANITGTFSSAGLGIGDTLTGTLVAFSTDGQSPSVGARILLPFQTTQTQNGIYTLTTVGSGSTAWVLTRATDYDQAAEIQPGDLVPVEYGTLYGGSIFLQTATVVTMDTSNRCMH